MDAIKRLKDSMVRVRDLVDFYVEHPTTTLDMMDSTTAVIIGDLERLLDGLADRDRFIPQYEIERDIRLAKVIVDEQEVWWSKGYDKGYQAGRDREIAWREMQKDD